jgi:hypothetical protein
LKHDVVYAKEAVEMSEHRDSTQMLERAAAELKQKGVFQQELAAADLRAIMRDVVNGLLAGQEGVRASIPRIDVRIENRQGAVTARVQVERPIKAALEINCVMANAQEPQRVRLAKLDIREEADLLARAALKAVDIQGKAREALRDPSRALFGCLDRQLEPKGVELTGIGLHFGEQTLAVNLRGRPSER